MIRNHHLSAMVAAVFMLISIGVGQFFKQFLASSRQGNLTAGCLGSLVFVYALSAMSNLKMASFGNNSKSGFFEIFLALLVAAIASGTIHRIAVTLCLLFSGVLLFFINGISNKNYAVGVSSQHPTSVEGVKKKK